MRATDRAVDLACAHGAQISTRDGSFGAVFANPLIMVSGPFDNVWRVEWRDTDGAEASETFTTTLAAVERAIALQGELK